MPGRWHYGCWRSASTTGAGVRPGDHRGHHVVLALRAAVRSVAVGYVAAAFALVDARVPPDASALVVDLVDASALAVDLVDASALAVDLVDASALAVGLVDASALVVDLVDASALPVDLVDASALALD